MALTRDEFAVLRECLLHPNLSQHTLAAKTGLSPELFDAAYRSLTEKALIENCGISSAGVEALKPFKVDNAVIMAAGLSSRFAPISYEMPKGLLNVRGEVLIERQIEQLKDAGINEIIIVIGYKKEYFFYLEEKYDVRIVVNPDFATHNNHSTLMRVRERLGNTYICSSDDYFTKNPFEPYVYRAYYAAQYQEGPTDEWCLKTNDQGRIVSVGVSGQDAWYMIGHAYFDRAFSERFARILEAEYDDPRTAGKLWEQLYAEHIDELDMELRRFEQGTIFEFDSLDDLREFDPLFLENIDSEIFDNIASVLGCKKSEIHDVYPLKQGLTNLSCHFSTNDGEYVYRHPGAGTELIIDRTAEATAQQLAKDIGLDETFLYENPERGWKLSRFIPNCRELDPHDDAQLARAMQMAAQLHAEPVKVDRRFDYLVESKRYEKALLEKKPIRIAGYEQMAANAAKLKAFADADAAPVCLTHNDFFSLNLLLDENDRLSLIDWEYAGMADYASDFGTFTVTCELSEEEALRALEHYFGRKPTFEETRHNFAYVALAGWCWYVWALLKEAEGDFVGDWLYIYYRYAKKYLGETLAWYAERPESKENGQHQ